MPPDTRSVFGLFNGLNLDFFDALLPSLPNFNGFAPRWAVPSKMINPKTEQKTSTILLTVNSKKEMEINHAPGFRLSQIAADEALVTGSALDFIDINKGQQIAMEVSLM